MSKDVTKTSIPPNDNELTYLIDEDIELNVSVKENNMQVSPRISEANKALVAFLSRELVKIRTL